MRLLRYSIVVLLCVALPVLAQEPEGEKEPVQIRSITLHKEGKPARTIEIENVRPSVAPDALARLSSVDVRDLSGIWVIEQDSRAGRVPIQDRQLRMSSSDDGSFIAEFVNGTSCPAGSGQRTHYIKGNLSGNLLSGSIELCPSAAFITKCGDESVYTTVFQAEVRDANTIAGRYRTTGYRIEAGGCVKDSKYDSKNTFLLERQDTGTSAAALAKDPEPGATQKIEKLRNAPGAESRRKKGPWRQGGRVVCKSWVEWHEEMQNGVCYQIKTCYMPTNTHKPCNETIWVCEKLEAPLALCKGSSDKDKFFDDDWGDQHGIE